MELKVTKAWCLAMAQREGNTEIGAGLLARDPSHDSGVPRQPAGVLDRTVDAPQLAFGRFVQLMRRRSGLSMETLATRAEIDLAELVTIEKEPHYVPEPRTVYQLAHLFRVPAARLLQLSGNTMQRDARLSEAAVRFAASSSSIERLTADEREALERFVAELSSERPSGRSQADQA